MEERRAGKTFSRADSVMTFNDGSRCLNYALNVMRMLGWAWRWAEQWVEWDSNWEPLIEPGEKEKDKTKKQLKIVDSTPESRAEDARRCRLAAFGAALRNRAYDTEDGFDNESLCRALNAILHTRSLVGPLKRYEISFCVDWLSRAYRSKSKFLGFGEDKIEVANDHFCVHQADNTPKYELGQRPLPGKQPLKSDQIFEDKVEEPDDFLLPELLPDGSKCPYPPNCIKKVPRKVFKFKKMKPGEEAESDDEELPKEALSSKPSVASKPATKPTKKEKSPASAQVRKPGRPPTKEQQSMASSSRYDSVAAMVPSAVKKRGRDAPRSRVWTPASSPPPIRKNSPAPSMTKVLFSKKKKKGLAFLEAEIEYQALLNANSAESVLRKRAGRGRPPKTLELVTYLLVGGQVFDPNNLDEDESEQGIETNTTGGELIETNRSENADPAVPEETDKIPPVEVSKEDEHTSKMAATVESTYIVRNLSENEAPTEEMPYTKESTADKAAIQESTDAKESTAEAAGGESPEKVDESTAEDAETKTPKRKTTRKRMLSGLHSPILEVGGTRKRRATSFLSPSTISSSKTYDEDDADDEAVEETPSKERKPKRKRMLAGLHSPIIEGDGTRKRRATNFLDPSNAAKSKTYDHGSSEDDDSGRDGDVRPPPKRRKISAGLDLDDQDGGRRRSSRHSLAKEKSLKEPDDSVSEVDLDSTGSVGVPKKGPGRPKRSSAKEEKKKSPHRAKKKKRHGRPPSKKRRIIIETDDDEELDFVDDESFHEPSSSNEDEEADMETRKRPRTAVGRATRSAMESADKKSAGRSDDDPEDSLPLSRLTRKTSESKSETKEDGPDGSADVQDSNEDVEAADPSKSSWPA